MATIEIAPEQDFPELEHPGRVQSLHPPQALGVGRLDGAALRARAVRAISETSSIRRAISDGRVEAQTTSQKNTLDLIAHDLANGLAAAKLCLAALFKNDRRPARRARDYVKVLRRSLQQMEEMVADLQDTRQMASGRFVVEPSSSVLAATLVSDAVDSARPWVSERTLAAACAPGLAPVRADERRIQRVFANLIGNAVKFTAPGGVITVGAGRGPRPRQVTFFVHDDGEGISPADQALVFEPHWQADRHRHRGSGLGLTVCRGIVEAHGGYISVTSRPGSGSTFAFTLPCVDESAR